MEAKLYGQNKGGTSINGIIKDYYAYAGENISAGDLVEYVNGVAGKVDYGTSTDTTISTTQYAGYTISAVALDENRVFIAHSYSSNYHLYGVVVTINGASITYGTDTRLSSNQYTGYAISASLLPDGRVFIAHSYTSNYYLNYMLCTIKGDVITVDNEVQRYTTNKSGYCISTCVLPDGNVFVAFCWNDSQRLYAETVTISGTTITGNGNTSVSYTNNSGLAISTCLLPNGNVFVAHNSDASNYYLKGQVCTISGTTITAGDTNDTTLVSTKYAGYTISAVTLEDNKVFIAHSHTSNTSGFLYGIVCTISGTTITAGTDTELCREIYAGGKISAIALGEHKVFIAHQYGGSRYLYGTICTISETTITAETVTDLISVSYAGYTISSLLLNNGVIFVAHNNSNSYYLNAQIFGIDYDNNVPTNQISITEYETQVRQVTTGQFDGVAKTSGEGGDDTGHKDIVSIWTYKSNMVTGVFPLTLEESDGVNLINYRLEGNSEGLGNLDENGKYVIPIRTKQPNLIDLSVGSYPVSKNGVTIDYRPSDGKLILNGTSTASTSILIYIYKDIDSAKTYNVAITTNGYINGFTSCAGYDENGTTIYDLALSADKTVEKSKSGFNQIQYIKFWCPEAVTFENCEVDIQIDEGDKYLMPITTNIYLDEPLRKVGNYADYIDFKTRKVVRQVKVVGEMLQGLDTPIEETIFLPSIPTLEGTTVLDSNVQPSNIEVEYFKK